MSIYLYLALVVLVTMAGMFFMLSSIRKIPENHRGVLFRFGRLVKELPAGTSWVMPLMDSVMLVNLSEQTIPLPSHLELAAGDKQYKIEGTFTCKIVQPIPAVLAAMQAQQDLSEVVGKNLVDELKQMGVSAIQDRPAQAEKWAIETLNEQMSQAWQVKFTKFDFNLVLV